MTAEEHELEQLRPASFAIAYRMLGSVSEAEDVELAHLGVVADFASLVGAHRPPPDTPIDPQPNTHNPGGTP
jgi:hypothetical protein